MQKTFSILTSGLFSILLFACAAFAQSTTVSGKVTYGDGNALHDVSVQISQLRKSASTNDDGDFSFSDVPPGRYTLIAHVEGFADQAKTIVVTAGAPLTVNFQLQITSLKEQVTVTASGTEQSVLDSFQSVDSVSSSSITQRSTGSLGDLLDGETGVAKRSFGVGSSRPVIRGFDGDRVLVLDNGSRSGTIGSQSGDHGETVDTLSAERVEIVKGPGTLLYGSNAIGGVVNVIDNDENLSHSGFRGNVTTVFSTANREAALSGGGEYGIGNFLLRGNFSATRSGDYQTRIGRVENSATRANTESFGLGYYGKKAYFNGNFSVGIRRYGIPYAAIFEAEPVVTKRPSDTLPVVDAQIDLRQRDYATKFSGGFRDLGNSFLTGIQYSLNYSDYRHKEIEIEDGTESIGTTFSNKTLSYRSLFEQAKYGKLTGRFGFDGFNRDYLVNGAEQLVNGKITQNAFSVFTLQEVAFERVKFQFGGRVENIRYNAQNPAYRDRAFTGFSGAAGVNFSLWTGGALVANYSNSFRAPALEELYNNGPHPGNVTFEIGNENLRGERSNGVDLTLRHQTDRFRFSGGAYYYAINNFVFFQYQDEDGNGEFDIEDGLPVARYEQDRARYLGVEMSADATFNKYLGAFLSLDAVRAKLADQNFNLPRIPPARARTGFDIRYKDLNVRPEVVFARYQNKVAPLETRTAGYGIVNVTGSYTIGRQHYAHIITFNAYNLTDKLYRNHLSFIKDFAPEIGRGIRVGYTVRFF